MDVLTLIIGGMLTTIFLMYVGYLLILKVLSLFSRRSSLPQTSKEADNLPRLSIIVPTYNEATVMRAKLESLTADSYPKDKCEIIVVDSGSTDGTQRIVEEYREKGVILRTQKRRMGKANAINFALQKARGDIIVLTDANAEFTAGTLRKIVQKFDGNTGAVLPQYVPDGKLSYWDRAFNRFHHLYKFLESGVDSVFIVFGELFAFRRDLIERINEDAASDDLEIALSIRKKGYKIRYSPDAEVKEKVPSAQKEVRIQKTRRIFGIVQAMINNFDFFLNPRYGTYGLLIFPTHFLQMTLGPFLVFSFLFLLLGKLCLLSINLPLLPIVLLVSSLALLILYFSVGFVRNAVSLGYNFLATEAFMIVALVNLARGKKYSVWEKIASTRERAEGESQACTTNHPRTN